MVVVRRADIRIGLSGWTYKPWRGAFYPEGLPQKRELAYAASLFRAIEVNGTFYGMQTPPVFARWADETPADFVFTIKAPRYITHIRRLQEIEAPLANFMASGLLRLGTKLGPLLWQFPPSFRFDADLMEAFLKRLPRDTEQAADLAKHHDDNLRAPAWTCVDQALPMRHAVEIRHDSFRDSAFTDLLRQYGVALVCADTVSWPLLMDLTADFVYCRLHGSEELYRSRYPEAALDRWAARVQAWQQGWPMRDGDFVTGPDETPASRDVFLFFDNTNKLHAPENAQALMQRLGDRAYPHAA